MHTHLSGVVGRVRVTGKVSIEYLTICQLTANRVEILHAGAIIVVKLQVLVSVGKECINHCHTKDGCPDAMPPSLRFQVALKLQGTLAVVVCNVNGGEEQEYHFQHRRLRYKMDMDLLQVLAFCRHHQIVSTTQARCSWLCVTNGGDNAFALFVHPRHRHQCLCSISHHHSRRQNTSRSSRRLRVPHPTKLSPEREVCLWILCTAMFYRSLAVHAMLQQSLARSHTREHKYSKYVCLLAFFLVVARII